MAERMRCFQLVFPLSLFLSLLSSLFSLLFLSFLSLCPPSPLVSFFAIKSNKLYWIFISFTVVDTNPISNEMLFLQNTRPIEIYRTAGTMVIGRRRRRGGGGGGGGGGRRRR